MADLQPNREYLQEIWVGTRQKVDSAGAVLASPPLMYSIGAKVRFVEPFRPEAVAPGAVGRIEEIEPLPAASSRLWIDAKMICSGRGGVNSLGGDRRAVWFRRPRFQPGQA
jgi:hypothetical protein